MRGAAPAWRWQPGRVTVSRPRRVAALVLAATLACLPAAVGLAAGAPVGPAAAARLLAQARALEADWGRCPTARPAGALLRRAERARRPALRARLALRAVRAYEVVAVRCSEPVALPTVVLPPAAGTAPPASGG